jgi:hypothetical protein
MFTKKVFLFLAIAVAFRPFPADAQPATLLPHLRFEQVVEAVGGRNDKITEDQLIAFLRSQTKVRLDQLTEDQRTNILGREKEEEFLERFADEQAIRKVINTLKNAHQTHVIEESELAAFESARLDPPLPPLMKDLLPPSVTMPPLPPPPPPDKSLLQRLGEVISVRQSFLDDRATGNPATFTWTKFGKSDETLDQGRDRTKFEVRGAITFEPKVSWRYESAALNVALNPVAVLEVDSSSDSEDKRDSVVHRVGFQSVVYRNLRWGSNFDVTIDYATDRDYKSEVLGCTFQYSPNAFDIGSGQWVPRREGFFHFRWRPFLGIATREIRNPGDNADLSTQKDSTNAFARIAAAIRLGSRIKITPEATWLRELKNHDKDHTAYGIAGQWLFDAQERVSLLISYEHGESAPTFKKKDVTKVALGLKL